MLLIVFTWGFCVHKIVPLLENDSCVSWDCPQPTVFYVQDQPRMNWRTASDAAAISRAASHTDQWSTPAWNWNNFSVWDEITLNIIQAWTDWLGSWEAISLINQTTLSQWLCSTHQCLQEQLINLQNKQDKIWSPMIIYRMVIVAGRCTMTRSSSLGANCSLVDTKV